MRQRPVCACARSIRVAPAILLLVLLLFALAPHAGAQDAPRNSEQSRSVFERGWQVQEDQYQTRAPRTVKHSRSSDTPASDEAAGAKPVEKLNDARVVLVIGDFMAAGLADALTDDYAQSAGVDIVDATKGSSGLVRSDFYDWPKEIGPILDAAKPAVVVVMLGANDRQAMTIGTAKEPPRSDAWTAEYVRRAEALTKAIRDRKIPLVWVGQPAFKYASMSSDMLAFDDIYQRVAEAAGGGYVDIWDGFVDENGAFRFAGPDVNGQPVRLRSDDGITLSKAGKRKVAFYVEKPLNKILGSAVAPGTGLPQDSMPSTGPVFMPAPSHEPTAPIPLSGLPADEDTDLLGSKNAPKPGVARTAAERLTIEGIAPSSPPGRADDFGGAGSTASAPPPASGLPIAPTGGTAAIDKGLGVTGAVRP